MQRKYLHFYVKHMNRSSLYNLIFFVERKMNVEEGEEEIEA